MNKKTTPSFEENFEILKQSVEMLKDPEKVNIDQLLPIVDQASQAYQMCKDRLDLIEKSLQNRLQEEDQTSNEKITKNQ